MNQNHSLTECTILCFKGLHIKNTKSLSMKCYFVYYKATVEKEVLISLNMIYAFKSCTYFTRSILLNCSILEYNLVILSFSVCNQHLIRGFLFGFS